MATESEGLILSKFEKSIEYDQCNIGLQITTRLKMAPKTPKTRKRYVKQTTTKKTLNMMVEREIEKKSTKRY